MQWCGTRPKKIFAFAGILTFISLGLGCEKEAPSASQTPRPVKYAAIGVSDSAVKSDTYSGSILPRDATALSFRVGGTIKRVDVTRGDTVKKGQLIAQLDTSDYAVALSSARANVQSARSQANTAKLAFRRTEKLFESGGASQADYEAAKGQLSAARAGLSAANQQAKQARNQIEYGTLNSPFGGIVNTLNAKEGEVVAAGTPMAILSRGGELEVSVGIPAQRIGDIKTGTATKIRIDSQKLTLVGKIREVGFASEQSTYPVRVSIIKGPAQLRPGMTAEVTIASARAPAAHSLNVPMGAVGNSEDGHYVYRLDGQPDSAVVKKIRVELGPLQGQHFPIKSGLSKGDHVAVAGLGSLVDGMKVRLLTTPGTR